MACGQGQLPEKGWGYIERNLELLCDEEGISAEKLLRKNGISRRTLVMLKRTPNGITRNEAICRSVDILHKGDKIILRIPEKVGAQRRISGLKSP